MRFNSFMLGISFNGCDYDNCMYFIVLDVIEPINILLYVKEMLIASIYETEIHFLKTKWNSEFEMKDIRKERY